MVIFKSYIGLLAFSCKVFPFFPQSLFLLTHGLLDFKKKLVCYKLKLSNCYNAQIVPSLASGGQSFLTRHIVAQKLGFCCKDRENGYWAAAGGLVTKASVSLALQWGNNTLWMISRTK